MLASGAAAFQSLSFRKQGHFFEGQVFLSAGPQGGPPEAWGDCLKVKSLLDNYEELC